MQILHHHGNRVCNSTTVHSVRNLLIPALAAVLLFSFGFPANAETEMPQGTLYETTEDSPFRTVKDYQVSSFSYDDTAIGSFQISGVEKGEDYNGVPTYFADGKVQIGYSYDGTRGGNDIDDGYWHLIDSDEKKVENIDLSKKVKRGAAIVERSADGKAWKLATDPICNFMKDAPSGKTLLNVEVPELREGWYYRVTIAYSMKRRSGTKEVLPSWADGINDLIGKEYTIVNCVEQYSFYLGYTGNPVTFTNVQTGEDISEDTVSSGFVIHKNGSDSTVMVSKDGAAATEAGDLDAFTDPGQYKIQVTTETGSESEYQLKVTDGMNFLSLTPSITCTDSKRDDYDEGERVTGTLPSGISAMTALEIGQTSQSEINHKGDCYGITGSGVGLYLDLSGLSALQKNGWTVVADDFGKKDKQTIQGAHTGTVESGALIVQKSANGQKWSNIDQGSYANGLFTTDYTANYGGKGKVCIYTPEGTDIENGVHIRVIFAYKAQNADDTKKQYRSLETYTFYLCDSNLDAVTFHNLTEDGSQQSYNFGDENEKAEEIQQQAETLTDGSCTVTGFQLDTGNNKTITCSINRNGKSARPGTDNTCTESGRYDISLKSPAGNTRTLTIYVDAKTPDEALQSYFPDFITKDSKRIYSEDDYPTYEGGKTTYHIPAVDEYHLPVSGTITNTTTGSVIDVPASREEKSGTLTEAGTYEAVFTTAASGKSGDKRTFTFHFNLIAEGTAPGPQVNQKNLKAYASSSPADSYPVYNGLSYSSALSGQITLAFATKEDAIEYAYQYEKGTVEVMPDGTYRYTGEQKEQKSKYDSLWDLTDDINSFADKEVKECYFDLSDPYTCQTLDEELLTEDFNPRTLELSHSVILFADEDQKSKLTSLDQLPLISPKPSACVKRAGTSAEVVNNDPQDFQFVHDENGYDSYKVTITDSTGKTFDIAHDSNVGEQLRNGGCATGVVKIHEETVYGDAADYEAVYLGSGENTAKVTLNCYQDGKMTPVTLTKADNGKVIDTDTFVLADVTDELSPYDLVLIEKDDEAYPYAADQVIKNAWNSEGSYQVKIVNRAGSSFSFQVNVKANHYLIVSFTGDGTDNLVNMAVLSGQKDVKLPELTKEGYTLTGYQDQNGVTYDTTIKDVDWQSDMTLTPVWEVSTGKESRPALSRKTIAGGAGAVAVLVLILLLAGRYAHAGKKQKTEEQDDENKTDDPAVTEQDPEDVTETEEEAEDEQESGEDHV